MHVFDLTYNEIGGKVGLGGVSPVIPEMFGRSFRYGSLLLQNATHVVHVLKSWQMAFPQVHREVTRCRMGAKQLVITTADPDAVNGWMVPSEGLE
jgi:hypothetical protein